MQQLLTGRHEASLARVRGRRGRVHQRDPHLPVGGHARADGGRRQDPARRWRPC